MNDYKSIKDWMSSHDTHSHGIRYGSIDLEDEESYPLEGPVDDYGTDGIEAMIDDTRELAGIFVSRLSDHEACVCAMIYGKSHRQLNGKANLPFPDKNETSRIKRRLSGLFAEFVIDYPELSESGMLKTLFSESVLERCENILKKTAMRTYRHR